MLSLSPKIIILSIKPQDFPAETSVYRNASSLRRKISRNMVPMEKMELNTTSCPASLSSPPICWAMVKEETAMGARTP